MVEFYCSFQICQCWLHIFWGPQSITREHLEREKPEMQPLEKKNSETKEKAFQEGSFIVNVIKFGREVKPIKKRRAAIGSDN